MADIIRLFEANETTFDHYETVLTDLLSFVSSEEENGIFSFEATSPLDDRIVEGKIIKAPTARGEQLFRIIRVKKVIPGNYLYIYGRHITYDLLNNFILNIRPTDTTQANALSAILGGTETAHTFTSTSDVPGINTSNYVRMNPIQAIMGNQSNSALNRWGGYLRRDNFEFKVLATSPDKGYEIRFGKNLIGIEEELDMTEVVTRFYPTVVIEEPTVTALPEKHVDSPLINNYPEPIIKEYRIDLTDDEKLLPIADIYQLMRDRCNEQFTLKADLPKMNYKIDFVQLRKTEQYKHLAILEELDISDTVWAYVDPLNLSMSARMIKYTHDGLNDRFMSMELGNFKSKLTNQKAEFTKLVETATKELTDGTITTMLKNAVDTIQGNLGGNVVTLTVDGKPVAMAFMDTDDVNTANEYVIINDQGIAFGKNGLSNPPEVAIDISGNVVATSGFFNSITTNLIQSDIGSDLVLSSNTSIKLLANSLVTIDENGITVGIDGSTIVSRQSNDGFRVLDGTKELTSVTEAGAVIPELQSANIIGNVLNTIGSGTYTVGVDKQYSTVTQAINDLSDSGRRRHLAKGATLKFNLYGEISDSIVLYDWSGGTIDINFTAGARLSGRIYAWFCNSRILIHGADGDNGTIKYSGASTALIDGYGTKLLNVSYLNFDKGAGATVYAFRAQFGAIAVVGNCDFGNVDFGLLSYTGSYVTAYDNKGSCGQYGMFIDRGTINAKGTVPKGVNGALYNQGFYHTAGTLTPTDSAYAPPLVVPTEFTGIFRPTRRWTYLHGTTTTATYYGATAAQGKWSGMSSYMDGMMSFGSDIYDYWQGGYNVLIEMRVRRQNSTHGQTAGVAPDPDNFTPSESFNAVARGVWTNWTTVPSSVFPSGGTTLRFYSPTLNTGYAIWDACEVRVTVTKDV